jgi:hypothetical protein
MDEQWQDQQCPTTRHAPVNRIRRGMTRTAIHAAVATPGRASSRSRWSCSPSRDTKDVTARDRRAARRHEGRAVLPLQVQGRHRPQPRRGLLRPDRRADHLGAHIAAHRANPAGDHAPLPRDCRGRQRGIPDAGAEPGRSQSLAAAKGRGELFRERMSALIEQLTEPGASADDRLRAAMALGGVSVGWMFSPTRWTTAASSPPLPSPSPAISPGPARGPATPA